MKRNLVSLVQRHRELPPLQKACPNCKETKEPCACMRNICIMCSKPVGNITFTVCDDCWDKRHIDIP